MNDLVLTQSQDGQIRAEAEAAYPNECCGVFLGRDIGERRLVKRLHALANSFESGEQYHRFRLDPLELARVEKEAGEAGLLVLGFYHSHPDHPARPSEYDREHAWPFYSYAIVSVGKGRSAEMTSWILDEKTEQFFPQAIVRAEQLSPAAQIERQR